MIGSNNEYLLKDKVLGTRFRTGEITQRPEEGKDRRERTNEDSTTVKSVV